MDMEDLVDDFVTFYVAGNNDFDMHVSERVCTCFIDNNNTIVHIYRSRDNIQHLFICHLSAK